MRSLLSILHARTRVRVRGDTDEDYDDDDDGDDASIITNDDHTSLRRFLLVCVLGTFDDTIVVFSAFMIGSSNNTSNRNATRPTLIRIFVVIVVLLFQLAPSYSGRCWRPY